MVYVCCYGFGVLFFFFKQKTAYEMRISDWSSDVCSSDLTLTDQRALQRAGPSLRGRGEEADVAGGDHLAGSHSLHVQDVVRGTGEVVGQDEGQELLRLAGCLVGQRGDLRGPLAVALDRKSTRLNSSH